MFRGCFHFFTVITSTDNDRNHLIGTKIFSGIINCMIKRVVVFFDKLEDTIRINLSHRPILYACIGGVGIVLFWKGVWETAELFPVLFGPVSAVIGIILLLLTGLLVSFFIGESIILSAFNKEKKLEEKTESEVRSEIHTMEQMASKLDTMDAHLERIEKQMDDKKC